jgi:hypothetical protein
LFRHDTPVKKERHLGGTRTDIDNCVGFGFCVRGLKERFNCGEALRLHEVVSISRIRHKETAETVRNFREQTDTGWILHVSPSSSTR